MGVVAFDWAYWSARFPELAASVSQATAAAYFVDAQDFCDNTPTSPIRDDSVGGQRYRLLHLVTAHIAALNAPLNGQPSSPLVGRISNATQGSVSVQTAHVDPQTDRDAYFQQTKYGAQFLAQTAQFKMFRYVPGRRRNFGAFR